MIMICEVDKILWGAQSGSTAGLFVVWFLRKDLTT